ncbi:MAG: LysR family transcriptional regulator [Acidobacteriota bacterium]|nr:LysR family transcriptional regulator [Acidobacteriota bacterium]
MDFDQLETFLEVARLSSFSRAAERRFRTQPAISSQIRALEEEVGAKLLDRSGGKVAVTAAGKVFQKYVEDTLEQRRIMLVALAEMHRVPRGEIVVSANEGTCLHILPEVFAEFKRQYPSVAVSVKRLEHNKILEAIIENSCDFGVVSLPVPDKRLTVVPIHHDELVVITPPHHPLAAQATATVAEVVEYPLLLPKVGRTRDALETLFHERGLKPIVSMELDSSELMKRFVAADVGVGFVPRSHVAEDLRARALAVLALADAGIRRDLALVYRKDKALSRAALAFIDIAVKQKPIPAASTV